MTITEREPTFLTGEAAPVTPFRRWAAPATFVLFGLIDIFVLGYFAHSGDATFAFSGAFDTVKVPNLTLAAAVTCYVCGAVTLGVAT